MKLSNVRSEAFKLDEHSLEYYFKGKSKNGRVHCKCYSKDHSRYSWLDKNLKKNTKVIIINPEEL